LAFYYRYKLSGGPPLILSFQSTSTETFTAGDMCSSNSGLLDLAATNDAVLCGVFVGATHAADASLTAPGTVASTASSTWLDVIVNPDAVYGVADSTARLAGATLDVSGATGAMTIGASSNVDFTVVETKKRDADETLVIIAPGEHYLAE